MNKPSIQQGTKGHRSAVDTHMKMSALKATEAEMKAAEDKVNKELDEGMARDLVAGEDYTSYATEGAKSKKPVTKKSDPYADAAKKDPKLGDYVKLRKSLEKGSNEWNKNQNKINEAYGVSKRYPVTRKIKKHKRSLI